MWKPNWNHHVFVLVIGFVFVSGAFGLDTNSNCSRIQFRCENDRCISMAWLCDGEDDCHDKSDEQNCSSTTCGQTDFKCKTDSACIPQRWTCDQERDCKDGSDEDDDLCKEQHCEAEEFPCGKNCITKNWICDGEKDCDDGEDEENCGKATCKPDTEFQCKKDNQCISSRWRCDRNKDCSDGSDEEDCSDSHYVCEEYEFKCADDQCVQKSWVCDGDQDCSDGSDEADCENRQDTCRKSEFQCKTLDHMCIHMSWKCDGDFDCEDQSDEKNCNITCAADQFLCEDNYCIHESLKCDGQVDCMSGSDEVGCPTLAPVCPNNTFDCHRDGSKCIPYSLVCDKWNDCGNNEDELTGSHDPCPEKNPCEENNGGCQHICFRSPDGAICDCHTGFELEEESKTECVDVNECLIPGTCSQTCINTKGSFKCECLPGYKLMHYHTCKATEGEPELLLADRKDLRRYNLHTKKYTLLTDKDVEGAIAMDFNLADGYIYWTDVSKEQILRLDLESNNTETVVSQSVNVPDGLAVDWVHGNMFWTDTGLDHIEVASLDGRLRKVLVRDNLDEPRAITVHPGKGLIFWTDWGLEPKIESCAMNGKYRKSIVSELITWPNGLTIDYVDNRLYWIDAKTHQIGSSDLDGQNRRMVLRGHQYLGHPFAITVFEDYVYWSDWPSESIRRFNKFQRGEVETVVQGLDTPMDIHILHPYRQTSYKNRCGEHNGGCQHFCLPDPVQNFTCECQNGHVQDPEDSKKCVKGATQPPPAAPTTREHPKPEASTVAPKPTRPNTSRPPAAGPKTAGRSTTTTTTTTSVPATTRAPALTGTEAVPVSKESDEGLGHVAIIVIAAVVIIALVVLAVGMLVFRRYRHRNIKSMNFDNPVYRKTTTTDEDRVYMEKSGSRQHLPSSVQPLNTDSELA